MSRSSFDSGPDSLHVGGGNYVTSAQSSHDRIRSDTGGSRTSISGAPPTVKGEPDRMVVSAPTPQQYQNTSGSDKIAIVSPDEYPRPPPQQYVVPAVTRTEPPPLPPKMPLPDGPGNYHWLLQPGRGPRVPTPPINMARKPDYRGR